MNNKKKNLKIIFTILSVALFVGLIIYLFPTMKGITTPEGRLKFQQKLDGMGIGKFWVLLALQFAQILLVVLPGEPLEVLAGMCYGTVGGTIFILATVFITTTLIFYLVKKYGKSYIEQFFKKEKIEKIENSKFFKNSKNIELVMMILFLIPGTPKDLLVYLGGLLPIKPWRFILISTFARFPSVISSTIVGSKIMDGNVKIIVMVYVATFILAGLIIWIVNKFDKNKVTKEAIKVIK